MASESKTKYLATIDKSPQCAFFKFRFAPYWGKEKLSSIIAPFLAGNDSYDGFIDFYQKKKCGKVWESMFFHLCLLSLLKPKVCA